MNNNPNDIDGEFIRDAFKNKERRNNPTSISKPLLPENEKKENIEKEIQQVQTPTTEEPKRKKGKSPDYENIFIQKTGITARSGKSVYIRDEYHVLIQQIIQVSDVNYLTLYDYIDNVLTHHFECFHDEVEAFYNKNYKGIFNKQK